MKDIFRASGSHPNAAADLRVEGATDEYYSNGLDLLAQQYLHDEISLEELQAQAQEQWEVDRPLARSNLRASQWRNVTTALCHLSLTVPSPILFTTAFP